MLFDLTLRKRTSGLTAVTVALALALSPLASVRAENHENRGPPVLRDTETEQLLREYTRPILRVAGLEKQNIQMVIINDPSFNAFVADGRRIFVNYGAILKSETPNQVIGVLAHETGHLAGGHLAKLRDPPHASVLSAPAGRKCRPCRREVPDRDGSVGKRNVRDVQALYR